MSNRVQILSIIGFGVASMFLAESWPGLFWFAPAASIGILRAYIIIHGPDVRDRLGEDEGYAMQQRWTWGTTVLVAAYVCALWYREKIGLDLMISLQVANILLVGAELYYSHLKEANPMREQLEAMREKLAAVSEELRTEREQFAQAANDVASEREKLAGMSQQFEAAAKEVRTAQAKARKMSQAVAVDKYFVRFCPNCATANRWTKKKESHVCACGTELCE
jgi:hypothetical protein